MYSKKVLELFKKPKNMGEIKNPDGIGKVGNPVCGDVMWIYIKVKKDKRGKETISSIKFKTFGCIAAIAVSSMVTEIAKGKTLEKAEKISKDDVIKALKGLPVAKVHCSMLAIDGLRKAIEDYRGRKK